MTQRIRRALEQHLAAMPGVLPIAYQNVKFPAEGQQMPARYLECFVMPARNFTPSLRYESTLHRGIFQINVSYPAAIGTRQAEEMAALLVAHFSPTGPALEFGGIAVRITEKPDVGQPLDRPGYVIPVSISYESIF